MRQVLWTPGAAVPAAEEILALLDRLPATLLDAPGRRSWLDRVEHYASVVGAALPEEAERARRLAAAIVAGAGIGPTVPVHGDFYENQLHVRVGRISGLLDVDTAGPGDRLDDLGCLLAHLAVLALIEPRHAAAVSRLGARYLAGFERVVDRTALRYRVAAVVLSLATGPHRVQERGWAAGTRHRLDLVERWLDSAAGRAGG
jgi:aminoglycoside phosphotransferase (APT) family kinase protein